MHPRSFLKLLIVSCVFAVSAVVAWINAPTYATGGFFGEKLVPSLADQINDIAVLSIEHEGKSTTFVREASGKWTLMEAANYPADKDRIRNTLIGISELEKVEPKTALAEFYPDIGVEDVSAANSKSYLVTMLDETGNERLSLLVGRSSRGVRWDEKGHFVRFPNDARSWLVRGALDVTGDARTWIETRLFPEDMAALSFINVADGSRKRELVFSRTDENKGFVPEYFSDPHFIQNPSFLAEMERTLKKMQFRNVVQKTEDLKDIAPFLFVRGQTFSGIGLYLTFYLANGLPFVEVTADAGRDADPSARETAAGLAGRHASWLYQVAPEDVSALFPFMALPPKKKVKEEKPESAPVSVKSESSERETEVKKEAKTKNTIEVKKEAAKPKNAVKAKTPKQKAKSTTDKNKTKKSAKLSVKGGNVEAINKALVPKRTPVPAVKRISLPPISPQVSSLQAATPETVEDKKSDTAPSVKGDRSV